VNTEDWEKKRGVIRHYNELADVYNALYRDEQVLKIESALSAVKIRKSDRVLDVGCGAGFLFDHIGGSVNLLVGIDISKGLLKTALNRSKSLRKRFSISLIRADADYMPFQKEVFDKVFALTLLQNVSDSNMTLREMMRVAKDNSTIIVTGLRKFFSEEEFENVLSRAGLKFSIINTSERIKDIVAICRKIMRRRRKRKREVGRWTKSRC